MSPDLPSTLVREGFALLAIAGAPFVLALLVVGLIVGVMQAATQINDPAVGFLPRALVGILVAWVAGPFAVERIASFFTSAVERMGNGP